MSFNVNFYTFSKKQRSTAVPSGTGKTVSCHANQTLDILAPEIILDWRQESGLPTVYNYARISDFGRWYWITGWRNDGGIWSASLKVDPLASWKSNIGNSSLYVYRSSSSYNGRIADTMYPPIARFRRFKINLPRMWSYGGDTALVTANGGFYILGITGQGATEYYAFTYANLNAFLTSLFADSYYNAVLAHYDATEFTEAKVAIDPMQYISSIRFWPCGLASPGTAWALHFTGIVGSIPVGPVNVSATAMKFTAVGAYPDQTSYNTTYYDLDITASDFVHPQAQERGDFLNLAPWTQIEFVYPPWGIIELNPADLLDCDYLRMRITADIRSGSALLTLSTLTSYTNSYGQTVTREMIIARSVAQVGVNCPLSKYQQTGTGASTKVQGAINAAKDVVMSAGLNTIGALKDLVSTAELNGLIPHLSVVGSEGSGASMSGDPVLSIVQQYASQDDLAALGRPLMDIRQLSQIPGYIKADPDELAVPCTDAELSEIRESIAGGFFYE